MQYTNIVEYTGVTTQTNKIVKIVYS